jgi:hypothetical protein
VDWHPQDWDLRTQAVFLYPGHEDERQVFTMSATFAKGETGKITVPVALVPLRLTLADVPSLNFDASSLYSRSIQMRLRLPLVLLPTKSTSLPVRVVAS